MMIKLKPLCGKKNFEDVKQALNDIGVNGITVSQVMGCGIQRGYKEIVRGMQVDMQMQPKLRIRDRGFLRGMGEKNGGGQYGNPPIQEKWETERYLLMRSVPC